MTKLLVLTIVLSIAAGCSDEPRTYVVPLDDEQLSAEQTSSEIDTDEQYEYPTAGQSTVIEESVSAPVEWESRENKMIYSKVIEVDSLSEDIVTAPDFDQTASDSLTVEAAMQHLRSQSVYAGLFSEIRPRKRACWQDETRAVRVISDHQLEIVQSVRQTDCLDNELKDENLVDVDYLYRISCEEGLASGAAEQARTGGFGRAEDLCVDGVGDLEIQRKRVTWLADEPEVVNSAQPAQTAITLVGDGHGKGCEFRADNDQVEWVSDCLIATSVVNHDAEGSQITATFATLDRMVENVSGSGFVAGEMTVLVNDQELEIEYDASGFKLD